MGRTCRLCFRTQANEQFGGRGQRAEVCKKCRRQPRNVWQSQLLLQEIHGFLEQSNISAKNMKRLAVLATHENEGVALLASVVKRIAQVQPRRRNRWKLIRDQHSELYDAAIDVGVAVPTPYDRCLDLDDPDAYEDDAPLPDDDCFCTWIEPRPGEEELLGRVNTPLSLLFL